MTKIQKCSYCKYDSTDVDIVARTDAGPVCEFCVEKLDGGA